MEKIETNHNLHVFDDPTSADGPESAATSEDRVNISFQNPNTFFKTNFKLI